MKKTVYNHCSILVICFAAGAYAVNLPKYFRNGRLFDSTCTAKIRTRAKQILIAKMSQKSALKIACLPKQRKTVNNLSKAETNNSTDCAEKLSFPSVILDPVKIFRNIFAAKFSGFWQQNKPLMHRARSGWRHDKALWGTLLSPEETNLPHPSRQ